MRPADETRPSKTERAVVIGGVAIATGIIGWGFFRVLSGAGKRMPLDCSKVEASEGEIAGFRYLERVTPGVDPESPLPMLVLFHSRGSRPEGHAGMFYETLGPVRVILPEGPHVLGTARSWTIKASVTEDQAGWAQELGALSEDLAVFLEQAVACRPTVGRPVMTGSSEGGHVAYLMASTHPELVAGAVAVAGYLPEPLWNDDMAPTVGLHGEADKAVPFARTAAYWSAMQDRGASLSVQSFRGVGHSVPSSVSRAWRQALSKMLG